MAIQWFPGHMNKTRNSIKEYLERVDGVLEVVDARAPYASRNPMLTEILGRKKRLLLLNKSDLTDPLLLRQWIEAYADQGIAAIGVSAKTRKNIDRMRTEAIALFKKSMTTRERSVRVLIVGVPNCGKSALINAMGRDKKAKTADRPGVTRDLALYRLPGLDVYDSPGTLWPNLEDQSVAAILAALGSVKDEIYAASESLAYVYPLLLAKYSDRLIARYGFAPPNFETFMETFAQKLGKVGDLELAAITVLRDLRSGRLGFICLETPEAFIRSFQSL